MAVQKSKDYTLQDILLSPTLFVMKIIGMMPTREQAEILENENKRILVVAGRQCITDNNVLYTKTGITKPSMLKVGDELVNGKVLNIETFNDVVYEVRLSSGIKLYVNDTHPLWVRTFHKKKGSWKTVREIIDSKKKYYIALNYDNVPKGRSYNLKKAKLFGYLFSDGSIHKNRSIKFTNINQDLLKDVGNIIKEEYKDVRVTYFKKDRAFDMVLVKKDRKIQTSLRNDLSDIGDKNESFGKILEFDKPALREFVRGYFNGDGYLEESVRRENPNKLRYNIGFAIGNNENLANEFQYILWKLGISSYVKHRVLKSGNVFYAVIVSGRDIDNMVMWLDTVKYPDKFKRCISNRANIVKRMFLANNEKYVAISKIKEIGVEKVYAIETQSGELTLQGGVRTHNCGKTQVLAWKSIWNAFVKPNYFVLIVSRTFQQAQIVFNRIEESIAKSQFLMSHVKKMNYREIKFDNGSTIKPVTGGDTGETIRGFAVDLLIYDEASLIPDAVFAAIEPSMAVKGKQKILSGTPYGKRGYFYNIYSDNLYKVGRSKIWDLYVIKTGDVLPKMIGKEEANEFLTTEKLTKTQQEYAQEYECAFLDEVGKFYPVDLVLSATKDYQYKLKSEGVATFIGVDVARFGLDETAIVIVNKYEDDTYKVTWCETLQKVELTQVAGRVIDISRSIGVNKIYVDSNGIGAGVVDMLNERIGSVVSVNLKGERRTEAYSFLKILLEQKKITLNADDRKMIYQFGSYEGKYDSNGQIKITKDISGHEDTVDALVFALSGEMNEEKFVPLWDENGSNILENLFNAQSSNNMYGYSRRF